MTATQERAKTTVDRMFDAMEKTKERLRRVVAAMESAGLPHAIIGGNAVAHWVATVDPGAVRVTRDVDMIIREEDLTAVILTIENAGFRYSYTWGVHAFVDEGSDKLSEGVHLLFEHQRVKPDSMSVVPGIDESESTEDFRVISLEALVRMKLESNRTKDRMHLVDLVNVGLINHTWLDKYPEPLRQRLKDILDDDNERFGFPPRPIA